MEKKGQFYIILVIILSIAVFGIVSETNKAEQPIFTQDFSELSQNYLQESPKVVNYALYTGEEATTIFPQFTETFLQQARKTNPQIGLIYIYSNGTEVKVRSYLNEASIIYQTNLSSYNETLGYLFGEGQVILEKVVLNVGGKEFVHEVPVTVNNFGEEFFETRPFPEPQALRLDIGGIFHTFNLQQPESIPELQILLRSQEGDTVEVYQTGNPDVPFTPT